MIYTFDHPISGQQEAEIFDPVVVIPEMVVIPWHAPSAPSVTTVHQYQYLLKVRISLLPTARITMLGGFELLALKMLENSSKKKTGKLSSVSRIFNP